MSCARYEAELDLIERSISHLVPQTHKYERNAALGVSGMVLLVPLFFMDISKAEEIELSAYVKRHNRLLELSRAANCGLDAAPIVVLTDDRGTPQSVDPIE